MAQAHMVLAHMAQALMAQAHTAQAHMARTQAVILALTHHPITAAISWMHMKQAAGGTKAP